MADKSPLDYVTAAQQATLKTPVINKTDQQVQDEQDSADNALKSLEQRYANPNWFNVAAGFFKPQLGGFAASLGSAAQVLGENVEQQRANELPIYAARAQLGALKSQVANRQTAGKEFTASQTAGFQPEALPALQARLSSLGANDLADSVGKMIEARQKDRSLDTSSQQLLTTQMAEDRALLTERRKQDLITDEQYKKGLEDIFARRQERPKPTVPGSAGSDIVSPVVGNAKPEVPVSTIPAAPAAPTSPAAPAAFKPLDPKADLTYGNLTPEQKAAVNTSVNKMLEGSKLRPIMGTDTGEESWNKNIARLKKENPTGLAAFVDAVNTQGTLSSTPTAPATAKAPASAAASATAKAPAPAAATPMEVKYEDKYALPHTNPMTATQLKENATTQANAAKANAGDENYYNAVKSISQPVQYKIADDANNFIIDQFKKNPKDVATVMDLVRKAGGLAAMVNQGMGVSFNGPFAVNVSVPVESGLVASLNSNQRTLFDAMAQSAATSAYFNMKQRGVDPEKAGSDKFAAQMQQEIGLKQTPGALFLAANKNAANLHMAKEAADIFDNELPKVNSYYAPHLTIRQQSPAMFKLEHKYALINKAHNKAFNGE